MLLPRIETGSDVAASAGAVDLMVVVVTRMRCWPSPLHVNACTRTSFVDAAYEKRSVAISSNLHPSGSTS